MRRKFAGFPTTTHINAGNLLKCMPRISPWQLLFYISWTVLGLWLILKSVGIIKTPFWLEYGVPIASVFLGVIGIYHNILEQIKILAIGLATLNTKFEHLDKKVDHLDIDVEHLKSDMTAVKKHLSV